MKGGLVFVLGALSGAVLAGWYLGVRPAEPPNQVTLLSRPAPAPPPAPAPIIVPAPAAAATDLAPLAAGPADPGVPVLVASEARPAGATQRTVVAMSASSLPKPDYIVIPVAGVQARQLSDSFNEVHSGQRHEAIDIMAPRGTPVVAVEDGRIAGVPGATACASAAASQLVRRMQPCDWLLPIMEGSGVPWMP